VLHPKPVHFPRELVAELLEEILAQQFLLKCVQDTTLEFITSNGQAIRARALVSRSEAHEAIRGADDVPGAAHSALREAREQVAWTVRGRELSRGFSKKLENLEAAVTVFVTWFNFCRVHQTLRVTPAKEAGLSDHIWTIRELLTAA
jgi:hypothetical protein